MDSFVAEKEKETKADQLVLDEHQESMEHVDQPEIVTKDIKRRNYTIEIAAGAILGALSVLVGFIWDATLEPAGWGPPFAPGMTWLDILAVPILVAFLIFGIRSGLIAAIIGCSAIIFFPGENGLGWFSMWPKFIATSTMFVIPWLLLRVLSKKNAEKGFLKRFTYNSDAFSNVGTYAFLMTIAIACRVTIMLVLNALLFGPGFVYLNGWSETFHFALANKEMFITYFSLGGWYALWNIVQGIAEAIITYSLVYPTKLHKVFKAW